MCEETEYNFRPPPSKKMVPIDLANEWYLFQSQFGQHYLQEQTSSFRFVAQNSHQVNAVSWRMNSHARRPRPAPPFIASSVAASKRTAGDPTGTRRREAPGRLLRPRKPPTIKPTSNGRSANITTTSEPFQTCADWRSTSVRPGARSC